MQYRQIISTQERLSVFERMQQERLLKYAMSAHADPSATFWLELTAPEHCIFLGCYGADDVLMGCATFTPFRGRCWEFDFTAFRGFFSCAAEQARGGFAWMFAHMPCDSVIGICPVCNSHAWKLARQCGFEHLGVLKGACFYAPKGKYIDGVMLMVTPHALKEVTMGFGGGGGGGSSYVPPAPAPEVPVYDPPETPKVQTSKPVTEAATAARQSQKDKANKAAGLQGSILTSPLQTGQQSQQSVGKTLLGQ